MAPPLLLANLILLLITAFSVQGFLPYPEVRNERFRTCRLLKETKNIDHDDNNNAAAGAKNPKQISADSIYFDMQVAGTPIGRLVFHLTNPSPLPFHTENLIQLAKGSRRSIDPMAHYVGCEFDHSPAFVEEAGGMGNNGRYKWGHQLKGRGRNAVGLPNGLIVDPENQLLSTHSVSFGGQYYGDKYVNDGDDTDDNDPGVVLTVPIVGPGRGSSKFSVVRVGESPKEWRERLLLNLGVVGKMDPSSLDVLHAMARQRRGPPTVVACGVLVLQEE
jgi:hypothetical protein